EPSLPPRTGWPSIVTWPETRAIPSPQPVKRRHPREIAKRVRIQTILAYANSSCEDFTTRSGSLIQRERLASITRAGHSVGLIINRIRYEAHRAIDQAEMHTTWMPTAKSLLVGPIDGLQHCRVFVNQIIQR